MFQLTSRTSVWDWWVLAVLTSHHPSNVVLESWREGGTWRDISRWPGLLGQVDRTISEVELPWTSDRFPRCVVTHPVGNLWTPSNDSAKEEGGGERRFMVQDQDGQRSTSKDPVLIGYGFVFSRTDPRVVSTVVNVSKWSVSHYLLSKTQSGCDETKVTTKRYPTFVLSQWRSRLLDTKRSFLQLTWPVDGCDGWWEFRRLG